MNQNITNKRINDLSDLEKVTLYPVDNLTGFFHIPGYYNYGISFNGTVINLLTKKQVNTSMLNSNYRQISLNQETKRYSRIVGRVFIGRPTRHIDKDFSELTINHIDGNKLNDDISNLEWVTNAENVFHSHLTGLHPSDKPTLAIHLLTGNIKYFNSSKQCADYFKIQRGTFYKKLTQQLGKFRIGLFTMCFEEELDLIEDKHKILSLPDFKKSEQRGMNVKVFDKKSKIITIYENLSKACVFHKLPNSTVFKHLVRKNSYENDDVIVTKL